MVVADGQYKRGSGVMSEHRWGFADARGDPRRRSDFIRRNWAPLLAKAASRAFASTTSDPASRARDLGARSNRPRRRAGTEVYRVCSVPPRGFVAHGNDMLGEEAVNGVAEHLDRREFPNLPQLPSFERARRDQACRQPPPAACHQPGGSLCARCRERVLQHRGYPQGHRELPEEGLMDRRPRRERALRADGQCSASSRSALTAQAR